MLGLHYASIYAPKREKTKTLDEIVCNLINRTRDQHWWLHGAGMIILKRMGGFGEQIGDKGNYTVYAQLFTRRLLRPGVCSLGSSIKGALATLNWARAERQRLYYRSTRNCGHK